MPKCPPDDVQRFREQIQRENEAKAEAHRAMRAQVDALLVLQAKGCGVSDAVLHAREELGGAFDGAKRAAAATKYRQRMWRVTGGHAIWMRAPGEGGVQPLPCSPSSIPLPRTDKENDMPRVIKKVTTTTTTEYEQPPKDEDIEDDDDLDDIEDDEDDTDDDEADEKAAPRRRR